MSDSPELIEPTESLREAFLDFAAEFRAAGEAEHLPAWCEDFEKDFAAFVYGLWGHSEGIGLPDGWVPETTYWLVLGGRILGVCHLRHRLTEALRDFGGHVGYAVRPSERNRGYATRMLKLVLAEARRRGLGRVLITCNADNPASARVIRKNGGVLDSESYSPRAERITQRYWVETGRANESSIVGSDLD